MRLRVTDAKGATATSAQTVTVRAKPLKQPADVGSSVSYSAEAVGHPARGA